MRKNLLLVSILVLALSLQYSYAQENIKHEIEGNVIELENFHEIIYPIWHEAYPSKDYDALKKYLPRVNNLADKLYSAELPGILRDKQGKWSDGIEKFKTAVKNYNEAVEKGDNDKLLLAAEDMHSKFEMLVRTIRPVTKEVDDFHKSLYVIYHYHAPQKKYDKILKMKNEMLLKAKACLLSELPKSKASKKETYLKSVLDLIDAVTVLKNIKSSKKTELITDAVENIHNKYQALEKIFD